MRNTTKPVGCLRIFLVLNIACALPVIAQQTVEERLSRLETRVDSIYLLLGPSPDTSHAEGVHHDSSNVYWGISGPTGTILAKEFFVINHNDTWKIPYWVGYYISASLLQGDTPRTNDFRPDPQLPAGRRSEKTDYQNSGYDRGHNAPAGDFKRSHAAMSSTFLLSNMSPQTPKLNREIWEKLEEETRQTVSDEGEGWIVTGNVFLDPDSHFVRPSEFIGQDSVAVPTHCFKVILTKNAIGANLMYAFMIPNQRTKIPGVPSDYLITVDRLEQITGYDFFPLLEDSLENSLESQRQSVWPR